MRMYKYLPILAFAITQNSTENTLLSKLAEYGVLGVVLALMLYKDFRNEQFLQSLINDMKKSIDKLSNTINNKLK